MPFLLVLARPSITLSCYPLQLIQLHTFLLLSFLSLTLCFTMLVFPILSLSSLVNFTRHSIHFSSVLILFFFFRGFAFHYAQSVVFSLFSLFWSCALFKKEANLGLALFVNSYHEVLSQLSFCWDCIAWVLANLVKEKTDWKIYPEKKKKNRNIKSLCLVGCSESHPFMISQYSAEGRTKRSVRYS